MTDSPRMFHKEDSELVIAYPEPETLAVFTPLYVGIKTLATRISPITSEITAATKTFAIVYSLNINSVIAVVPVRNNNIISKLV
jgi:hypothetical protein